MSLESVAISHVRYLTDVKDLETWKPHSVMAPSIPRPTRMFAPASSFCVIRTSPGSSFFMHFVSFHKPSKQAQNRKKTVLMMENTEQNTGMARSQNVLLAAAATLKFAKFCPLNAVSS